MNPASDITRAIGRLGRVRKERWRSLVQGFAPPAVTAVLIILVAHQLASLTWIIVPSSTFDAPLPVVAPPDSGAHQAPQGANLAALANSHLFGQAASPSSPSTPRPITHAPDTRLDLTLAGVVASNDPDKAQAIIADSGQEQKQYAVGQTINHAGGATLYAVYADRVILSRNGILETLRLPQKVSQSTRRTPAVGKTRRSAGATSLRSAMTAHAASLRRILRATPQLEGGKMVGFRLNSGDNKKAFAALGLEPGDVVTRINGTVLDNAAKSMQVFQSLGEATQAHVTILRHGVPKVLVLNTSQIQKLGKTTQ